MMQDDSTVYKIPKTWVWFLAFISCLWIFYKIADWATHVNWPPADLSNQTFIKELNKKYKCNEGEKYDVTEKELGINSNSTSPLILGIDRKVFFDHPECTGAGLYLSYEGSGIRKKIDIYDINTKLKTATIVITHEKFEHQ